MSIAWESTILLRVTDEAYVRTDLPEEGREAQKLVECPRCHRVTDWLIVAATRRVEVACRCGRRWRLAAQLPEVVALAECPPRDPAWTCLEDARAALGFGRRPGRPRRWRRARRRSSVMLPDARRHFVSRSGLRYGVAPGWCAERQA